MKIQDALDLHLKEEASRIIGERTMFRATLTKANAESLASAIMRKGMVDSKGPAIWTRPML